MHKRNRTERYSMSKGRVRGKGKRRASWGEKEAAKKRKRQERMSEMAMEQKKLMIQQGSKGAKPMMIDVTPQLAASWLLLNVSNRKLRTNYIRQYIQDILTGNWAMIGCPIKFSAEGQLMDGQHRLTAIVRANKCVKMVVMVGVNPNAFTHIDSGASRTVSDSLFIKGVSRSREVASIINVLNNNGIMGNRGVASAARNAPIYDSDPQRFDTAAEAACQVKKLTMSSAYGAFFYLALKAQPEKAQSFHRKFVTGTAEEDNPARFIREHMRDKYPVGKRSGRDKQVEIGLKLVEAFKKYCEGKPMKRVKVPEGVNVMKIPSKF